MARAFGLTQDLARMIGLSTLGITADIMMPGITAHTMMPALTTAGTPAMEAISVEEMPAAAVTIELAV
jgi:hypothetical protein